MKETYYMSKRDLLYGDDYTKLDVAMHLNLLNDLFFILFYFEHLLIAPNWMLP